MKQLPPQEFNEFYRAATLAIAEVELAGRRTKDPEYRPNKILEAKDPFPWQTRLALRVCNNANAWPRAIALPTAAGKTACIDIAVFALACLGPTKAPRRIFFVVDRRIVVDQARMHADSLAEVLRRADSGILKDVADSLREIAQGNRPLDVYSLRGGMYRETAWIRSPLQPTVIASTVDQVGSRLLFRGYGVSDSMKPIHAGLVGNDSLILLDEAHCAKPFDQTMQAVTKYRDWTEGEKPPFRFVSLTATPSEDLPKDEILRADEKDYEHAILGKRISASKPANLVVAEKAKGKNWNVELVKILSRYARDFLGQDLGKDETGHDQAVECVGIIVNRVKTARELKATLGDEAVLLTGRMRPLDRDKVFEERLKPLLSNAEGVPPKFVIGTQCLECGVDFDFHALVTECASLDALRQRFGRLNRVASRATAKAAIVIRADQIDDTSEDPVYGSSLANTWKWLASKASGDVVDFGVSAVQAATDGIDLTPLNAPSSNAPILFPGHLDSWVQTNPIPNPDPDPALFLHGPTKAGLPDIQVVFRDDIRPDWSPAEIQRLWNRLNPDSPLDERMTVDEKCNDLLRAIVGLCPPSAAEALSVRISDFKRWLGGLPLDETSSDVGWEPNQVVEGPPLGDRIALRWKGQASEETVAISDPNNDPIYPGDLFVIPCSAPGIDALGDIPNPPADYAEQAFLQSRDKAILRMTDLELNEEDYEPGEFQLKLTEAIQARIEARFPLWPNKVKNNLLVPKLRVQEPHLTGGWVVRTRHRLGQFVPDFLEDDQSTESPVQSKVDLIDHSLGVAQWAQRFAGGCGLEADLFFQAGLWHDLGKLDPRFQAMLKQSSPRTAVGVPLAKSGRSPRTMREREEARQLHRYPKGARHELLSTALVATKTDDDLLLHMITTHHGSARPFADPVEENREARRPFTTPTLFGESFELPTSAQEIRLWNAELPERFWRTIRRYGWWGAAYREAVFRLADHAQSRAEQENENNSAEPEREVRSRPFAKTPESVSLHALPLPGLDGGNPLGFLAALGTLECLDRITALDHRPSWLQGKVALSWQAQMPILHLPGPPPPAANLAEFLNENIAANLDKHPSKFVVSLFENRENRAKRLVELVKNCSVSDRPELDWVVAHFSEIVEDATSQLLTVRRDFFPDNVRSILSRCKSDHLARALFHTWDYGDGLDNQSLHWEPGEDRRHAYQWNMPSGDPTRKKRGGMLGANRLALEAWPLFPSFPSSASDRLTTRGFKGNRANTTFWTWPLWGQPLTRDAVGSMLGFPAIYNERIDPSRIRDIGIVAVFRLQKILAGKTPNFTTAAAIA